MEKEYFTAVQTYIDQKSLHERLTTNLHRMTKSLADSEDHIEQSAEGDNIQADTLRQRASDVLKVHFRF